MFKRMSRIGKKIAYEGKMSKKNVYGESYVCYYCGLSADTVDHVIPQKTLLALRTLDDEEITRKIIGERILMVWACRECNCIAGYSFQDTLSERKQYVLNKLAKRYKGDILTPDWADDELSEMSGEMRKYIRHCLKKRDLIRNRIGKHLFKKVKEGQTREIGKRGKYKQKNRSKMKKRINGTFYKQS